MELDAKFLQFLSCNGTSEGPTLATSTATSSIQVVCTRAPLSERHSAEIHDWSDSVCRQHSLPRRRLCSRRLLPTLSCQPHVARLSATERSPSLVREPGTVYRLLFARPLHRTVSLKNNWNHSRLDNLFVCDNMLIDSVRALVAVCT